MRRYVLAGFVSCVLAGLFLGAVRFLDPPTPPAHNHWRGGVVRVGYALGGNFAFKNALGVVTGESPEVARVVLERAGVREVNWVRMDFGELIGQLESGAIDMIATGMRITPARAARVAFSLPTCRVGDGHLHDEPPGVDSDAGGEPASGLCAFAFHKRDARLLEAVNRELRDYLGTPEHLHLLGQFGLKPDAVIVPN